jgi:hypothetical protein
VNPVLRVYLFAAAGALFALLWLVNVLLKTLGGKRKVGTIDLFLAFTTTILLVLTLVFNQAGNAGAIVPAAQLVVLAVAAIVLVVSLIFMLIESRREDGLKQSRGILGIAAAILVILSSFTVPLLSARLHYTPGQATLVASNGQIIPDTPSAAGAPVGTDTPIPTNTTIPSPTPTETPTMTRTPYPSDTPTMTLVGYSDAFSISNLDALDSTQEVTATATAPAATCMILINYNLRVRTAPFADADTLTVIPFGQSAPASAVSQDLRSYLVTYDGKEGWIDGQYATAGADCGDLPVKSVPTPTVSP